MIVPEYLRRLRDTLTDSDDAKRVGDTLSEVAARWEMMEQALADAEAVAKYAWDQVGNNPASHRRQDYEFYRDTLSAARAPLEDKK